MRQAKRDWRKAPAGRTEASVVAKGLWKVRKAIRFLIFFSFVGFSLGYVMSSVM